MEDLPTHQRGHTFFLFYYKITFVSSATIVQRHFAYNYITISACTHLRFQMQQTGQHSAQSSAERKPYNHLKYFLLGNKENRVPAARLPRLQCQGFIPNAFLRVL